MTARERITRKLPDDFHEFVRAPGLNGHFLINDPLLWETTMDGFLDQL
ncbi:MAG: hypothetical protein WBN78_10735 [Gammaproteobacteria bacterium]